MLTEKEEYVLYKVLHRQCAKICEMDNVRHNTWDSIYSVCSIFSLTPILSKYFKDPTEAVTIFRSLEKKGFVTRFDKNGAEMPSFVPCGWDKIKEVDVKFVKPFGY
jgi:hypothetical protein